MILAAVTINLVIGENGIIARAQKSKFEMEKAESREQIEIVLADASIDKQTNPQYNENEFLDNFINERLPNVYLNANEVGLKGYIFELDRSVPRLGEYIGKIEGPRIKEIKVTNKTTSSISILVDATDAEGASFTYLYKKDVDEENSWKEAGKQNINTFTFEKLEANTIYNIKVQIETKGGSTEKVINVLTGELPIGAITFTDPIWSNGAASVTINTEETVLKLQYQIDSFSGSWTDISSGSKIEGLKHGQTVYAILTDGTNETEPASVSIKDTIVPIVSQITTGAVTDNSITVTVIANDNESGLASTGTYKYFLNGTETTTIESNTYTFSGLSSETNYNIKVEAYDQAGNKGENTITVKTAIGYPTVEDTLKAGNYVNYTDGKGTKRTCVVLYDNSSGNGVQLITMQSVETLTLGTEGNAGIFSDYNNAISILNGKANEYNNSTYSTRARCVGSVPNNPDYDAAGMATSDYMYQYSGSLKAGDSYYETDYNQMKALQIHNIGEKYWLASRSYSSNIPIYDFAVRYVAKAGAVKDEKNLCTVDGTLPFGGRADAYGNTFSAGLRPVFMLNPGTKVIGGNGTSIPFELGA